MSALKTSIRPAPRERGFTLVELMVTLAIALFLLGGLLTVVQNIRGAYSNQQQLTQLQDEQRFALTVITDAIQAAGYFGDPTVSTTGAFPAAASPGNGAAAFGAGWVFTGSRSGATDNPALDTLATRFQTSLNYGPILCNGTDTSQLPAQTWTIVFSINAATNPNTLQCSVNGAAPVTLVNGVQAMSVYYGVKRNVALADYNVDTYERFDVMQGSGNDWANISSVRVVLTFQNPVVGPSQPPTVTIERVIEVMARAGVHT